MEIKKKRIEDVGRRRGYKGEEVGIQWITRRFQLGMGKFWRALYLEDWDAVVAWMEGEGREREEHRAALAAAETWGNIPLRE